MYELPILYHKYINLSIGDGDVEQKTENYDIISINW